ncbi:MAG: hypothetical protein LBL93_00805 [Ruminococcus sp.]|jgi:hypothetical protein|nr:hypothetical protein [Ruminococcus sp.]
MTIAETKPFISRLYDKVSKIKSSALKNYFVVMLRNQKVFIGSLILSILGLPLIALATLSEAVEAEESSIVMFATVGITSFILSLVMGFVYPRTTFNFLISRSQVDTRLALPLNKKGQFFSNYFAAITLYLVPYIIGALISILIYGTFVRDTKFDDYPELSSIILGEFGFMLAMIMFITVQVFALTFTGSRFEEKIFTIVSLGIVPLVIVVYGSSVFINSNQFAYGVSFSEVYFPLFTSNPVGGGIYSMIYIFSSNSIFGFWNWFIGFFVWLVIYFALAYFYFMKRKAEQVGTPIVFMSVYNVLILCFLFVSFLPLNVEEFSEWGVGTAIFIISAIVYAIIETIRNRGFYNIAKSFIRYGVCAITAWVLIMVSVSTGSFGIYKYVPSKLSVESVSINYYGAFRELPSLYSSDMSIYSSNILELKEKENIQLIINMHKKLVENKPNYEENYSTQYYTYYNIVYKLKSGTLVSRDYHIPIDYVLPLTPIISSDEYIEHMKNSIYEGFGLNYNYTFEDEYYRSFSLKSKLEIQSKRITINNRKEFCKELQDAYGNDLKAMTEEDYRESGIYCKISLPEAEDLAVLNSFTNTIALLNKYNFKPYSINEELETIESKNSPKYNGFNIYYNPDGTAYYYDDEGNYFEIFDDDIINNPTDLTMKIYQIDKNPIGDVAVASHFRKEYNIPGKLIGSVPVKKWTEYLEKSNNHIILTNSDNLNDYYSVEFYNDFYIIKASDVNLNELLRPTENDTMSGSSDNSDSYAPTTNSYNRNSDYVTSTAG